MHQAFATPILANKHKQWYMPIRTICRTKKEIQNIKRSLDPVERITSNSEKVVVVVVVKQGVPKLLNLVFWVGEECWYKKKTKRFF